MKNVFALLLCLPALSFAQIKDKGITCSLYAGLAYLPNSFFEGIDVSYHQKKHAYLLGPYFTKTLESNFDPGVHVGYQFYPKGRERDFHTFFAFDYLYFKGAFDAEPFSETETTRHILNVSCGANFFLTEQLFLSSNLGIGYVHITDSYNDVVTGKDGTWGVIGAIARLGIGYSFSK